MGVTGSRGDVLPGARPYPIDLVEHALLDIDANQLHTRAQHNGDREHHDREHADDHRDAQRPNALTEKEDEDREGRESDATPEQPLQQLPAPDVLDFRGRHGCEATEDRCPGKVDGQRGTVRHSAMAPWRTTIPRGRRPIRSPDQAADTAGRLVSAAMMPTIQPTKRP